MILKPKSLKHRIADKLVFLNGEGLGGNMITLVSGSAPLSTQTEQKFQGAGIPILGLWTYRNFSSNFSKLFRKCENRNCGHV